MAILRTSGTYTYSTSFVDLITDALRIAQVVGDEETPTGAQLQGGIDAMNAMVKGWGAAGIHVWCEEEIILFLQPGQIQYQIGAGSPDHATLFTDFTQAQLAANAAASASSVQVVSATGIASGDQFGIQLENGTNFWTTVSGAPSGATIPLTTPLPSLALAGAFAFDYAVPLYRPLRVMGGRRYTYLSRQDIQCQMWARLDYANQPNKTSTGIPTAFFYDPQTGQGSYQQPVGLANIWPNPQDNTNAMRFTAQRPIQDVGTLANTPDFPVEWNAALKWNIALELAPAAGVPLEQLGIIERQAERWYRLSSAWDRESESVRFGVAFQPGQRRG